MEIKQNIVPLKNLNLSSRFLFDEVMENIQTHQDVLGIRVCKVRMNEEVGVKYMQAWEEKYYEREEGREGPNFIGV